MGTCGFQKQEAGLRWMRGGGGILVLGAAAVELCVMIWWSQAFYDFTLRLSTLLKSILIPKESLGEDLWICRDFSGMEPV